MKSKILYLLAFMSVLSFSSCEDELDKFPYNALEEQNAFNTPIDFDNAVKGMYQGMVTAGNYYGGSDSWGWIITPDVLADNLIMCQNGRLSQKFNSEWRQTSETINGPFANGYRIIRRANAIIENISKLPDDNANKKNYLGEAHAIRGMVHFDLARLYAKRYIGASDAELGIPYVTSTDPNAKPARETLKKSFENIVNDLKKGIDNINASNGVGRINKAAVQGILSRVYLYMGEWDKCIEVSNACLATNSNPGSIADFRKIWTDETENGVLFKIKILDKDRVSVGVGYSQTSSAGIKSEYVCTYDLYQLFKNEDIRKTAYITTSSFNGVLYNHIAKYLGRPVGNKNVVDVKVIRVAEVLLNRAEAYVRKGAATEANALADLDVLRKQRYSNFTPGTETGQALLDAILLERRVELAFEGDRFFDLKRRGADIQRDAVHGDRADGTGTKFPFAELKASDYRFQLPFPQSEINVNPNLQQNDGYK